MLPKIKTKLQHVIEHKAFERLVITIIIANSIVLGLETYQPLYETHAALFTLIDTLFLTFFVSELVLRIALYRRAFFMSGWNWFDFIIVLVSVIPFIGNLSALRALRILRALRLLSIVPEFRDITESLVRAAKGASAVFGILGILLYVFAVMSSKLFGAAHPTLFGNLQISLFTHVQLMVFDGWGGTVGMVVASHGFLTFWYFLAFSIVLGFVLISMLVGVIVEAKQSVTNEELLQETNAQQNMLIAPQ